MSPWWLLAIPAVLLWVFLFIRSGLVTSRDPRFQKANPSWLAASTMLGMVGVPVLVYGVVAIAVAIAHGVRW